MSGIMDEGMAFAKKAVDGRWALDVDAIGVRIDAYIAEAEEVGKYSMAGLCISLGITKDTLDLWRLGYVSEKDYADVRIGANEALAACVGKGELYIHRYWEECDKSAVQSKYVKMMECAGVFDGRRDALGLSPPFDLGGLGKYCK